MARVVNVVLLKAVDQVPDPIYRFPKEARKWQERNPNLQVQVVGCTLAYRSLCLKTREILRVSSGKR